MCNRKSDDLFNGSDERRFSLISSNTRTNTRTYTLTRHFQDIYDTRHEDTRNHVFDLSFKSSLSIDLLFHVSEREILVSNDNNTFISLAFPFFQSLLNNSVSIVGNIWRTLRVPVSFSVFEQ